MTLVLDYYNDKYGGIIKSSKYGDIVVDKKAVKNDNSHGMTNEKAIAYEAVPTVIDNGLLTKINNNYNGKLEEDRIIISAPVTIDGVDMIESVVLRQSDVDKNSRVTKLYLHSVSLIEKENGSMLFNNPNLGIRGNWATPSVSDNNISNSNNNVKQFSISEAINENGETFRLSQEQIDRNKNSVVRDNSVQIKYVLYNFVNIKHKLYASFCNIIVLCLIRKCLKMV